MPSSMAECQNRCPSTYLDREEESEEEGRRDWNIMDLLAPLSLASKAMQIRESAATQTERRKEDGTTAEFPTLRCLFTLFSWAWKLSFPTRLVIKITTRIYNQTFKLRCTYANVKG